MECCSSSGPVINWLSLTSHASVYTAQLKKVLHNYSQNKVDSFAAKSNMCMNGKQEHKNDPAGGGNRKACYKNKHPCVVSVSSFVSSLLCMNTSDGLLLSSGLVVCVTKDEIW